METINAIKEEIESTLSTTEKRFMSRHLDIEARKKNLYGVRLLECQPGRKVKIAVPKDSAKVASADSGTDIGDTDAADTAQWVIDFATNGPFGLNLRPEIIEKSVALIRQFGTLHTSIAAARAQTGIGQQIIERLQKMKGPQSAARIYPTTFAANCAIAGGLNRANATVVMHPNVHATVQFAIKGALSADRIIRSKNTAEVAATYAQASRRKIVVVEDGLYSMGKFANFAAISAFLAKCPNGMVWFDDAHSVGMRGQSGRGEAMEQMKNFADQSIITGSFGKAFGAAGGFAVAPESFVRDTLEVSVSDRFSCNADVAAQGAILAAMELLEDEQEYSRLQSSLNLRLKIFDQAMSRAGVVTEQEDTPIAFRVVPFDSPEKAIAVAGELLEQHKILSTPVYFPTVAHGTGAIRFSISADHKIEDLQKLIQKLTDCLVAL